MSSLCTHTASIWRGGGESDSEELTNMFEANLILETRHELYPQGLVTTSIFLYIYAKTFPIYEIFSLIICTFLCPKHVSMIDRERYVWAAACCCWGCGEEQAECCMKAYEYCSRDVWMAIDWMCGSKISIKTELIKQDERKATPRRKKGSLYISSYILWQNKRDKHLPLKSRSQQLCFYLFLTKRTIMCGMIWYVFICGRTNCSLAQEYIYLSYRTALSYTADSHTKSSPKVS